MRITVRDIREMRKRGEKVPMVTSYDYTTARLVDEAGFPIILVGDSLGQVVLGYESTIPVTMVDMIHHVKAVVRGAKRPLIVADMPFMTYHLRIEQALENAGRFIQEGGAGAVKLEGGITVADKVKRIVECGIPVMGHIGLTPQSIHQLGGYRVQGKTSKAAQQLMMDALALEQAGAFSIVLELVPSPLARLITQRLSVPTIGIGAGPDCDGQVQVFHDMMGLFPDFVPRHAKQYAQLAQIIKDGLARYVDEVKAGQFPTDKESYPLDESVLAEFMDRV